MAYRKFTITLNDRYKNKSKMKIIIYIDHRYPPYTSELVYVDSVITCGTRSYFIDIAEIDEEICEKLKAVLDEFSIPHI